LRESAALTVRHASPARHVELFRGITDSSAMFEDLPWFTRLRERGPELMEALERRHRRQGTLGRSFRRVADLRHGITVAAERVKAANGARPNDAAAEEEPVEAARRADAAAATAPPTKLTPDGTGPSGGGLPGEPAASPGAGRAWRPSGSGRLRESSELVRAGGGAGADLGTIVGGARRERSMFRPGRVVDRLVEPDVFDETAVASSGVTL